MFKKNADNMDRFFKKNRQVILKESNVLTELATRLKSR